MTVEVMTEGGREPAGATSRARLFHGWYVIGACFVAGMMIYGAGLYGFTLLIPPLSEQFGWSRAATGGLVSIFWLAAPLTPLGGYCNRRFGPGRLIMAAIVLEAICLVAVGFINSLFAMYCLRALMGVGKVMMMAGVTGQSAIWFRRHFGMAVATCFAGWHFGGLVIAPSTQWIIDHFGWRMACFVLGGAILLIAMPPMLIWGRGSSPQSRGLFPDGDLIDNGPAAAVVSDDAQLQPRQVLATPAFWMIVAITILGGYPYGALIIHEVALLTGAGIAPAQAATALGLTAGSALVGTLITGFMSDRISVNYVLLGEMALMTLSVLGFLTLLESPSPVLMFVCAIGFGLALGSFDTGIVAGLQKRFGHAAFNSIFGVWYFFYLMVLLLGPIAAGALFDRTGSYHSAIALMLGGMGVACLIALLLARSGPPRHTS